MTCYHPLMALRMKNVLSKSGSPVVKVLGSFDSQNPNYMRFDTDSWLTGEYDRTLYERIVVPCGHCVGCRLKRSRDWALRCMCEASLYKENCFVTITYDDEHLTGDRISLSLDDVQKFIKRVRKKFSERKVRVFYCGEYGSKNNRPHFHIIFFNLQFEDKVLWSIRNGVCLYRSPTLEALWQFGFSTVGEVTFDSAAYVARYTLKKSKADLREFEAKDLKPPFVNMSRRPGIGHDWLVNNVDQVYPNDFIVSFDKKLKLKPSRYFDSIYDVQDPDGMNLIRESRKESSLLHIDSKGRLWDREQCKEYQLKQLPRHVDI